MRAGLRLRNTRLCCTSLMQSLFIDYILMQSYLDRARSLCLSLSLSLSRSLAVGGIVPRCYSRVLRVRECVCGLLCVVMCVFLRVVTLGCAVLCCVICVCVCVCVCVCLCNVRQGNEKLMRSLSKLVSVNKPDLILFVGEALVGNLSIEQITKFNQVPSLSLSLSFSVSVSNRQARARVCVCVCVCDRSV